MIVKDDLTYEDILDGKDDVKDEYEFNDEDDEEEELRELADVEDEDTLDFGEWNSFACRHLTPDF